MSFSFRFKVRIRTGFALAEVCALRVQLLLFYMHMSVAGAADYYHYLTSF